MIHLFVSQNCPGCHEALEIARGLFPEGGLNIIDTTTPRGGQLYNMFFDKYVPAILITRFEEEVVGLEGGEALAWLKKQQFLQGENDG